MRELISKRLEGRLKIKYGKPREEAFEDFVTEHKELYNKGNQSVSLLSMKGHLWQHIADSRKRRMSSVHTWLDSQHTQYSRF